MAAKSKADLEKEIAEKDTALATMQEQMNQMMTQMQQLMKTKTAMVEPTIVESNTDLTNKKIKVVSLIANSLNLSTEQGRKYPLEKYGDSRMIRYDDLESIVMKHSKFLDCFYICNRDAVKELGLEDEYERMVDKKTMDDISNLVDEVAVERFKGLSEKMQENAVELIVEKMVNGQYFDENYVYAINQFLNKNLRDIADERKKLLKKA